jgi:hypothetical protein
MQDAHTASRAMSERYQLRKSPYPSNHAANGYPIARPSAITDIGFAIPSIQNLSPVVLAKRTWPDQNPTRTPPLPAMLKLLSLIAVPSALA